MQAPLIAARISSVACEMSCPKCGAPVEHAPVQYAPERTERCPTCNSAAEGADRHPPGSERMIHFFMKTNPKRLTFAEGTL